MRKRRNKGKRIAIAILAGFITVRYLVPLGVYFSKREESKQMATLDEVGIMRHFTEKAQDAVENTLTKDDVSTAVEKVFDITALANSLTESVGKTLDKTGITDFINKFVNTDDQQSEESE